MTVSPQEAAGQPFDQANQHANGYTDLSHLAIDSVSHDDEWRNLNAISAALNRVQAIIEFSMDGTIRHANDNFLDTFGYTLGELVGQHHRMLCEPQYVDNIAYRQFWEKLGRGEFDQGEYKRIAKNGKPVWISASYTPVLDAHGRPYKVVKFATDVTALRLQQAEQQGRLAAISKAQAVIEFSLDGIVLAANENFLATVGYTESEIVGQHHRMFCDEAHARSPDYAAFWEKLRSGAFDSGEYRRVGKGGREIWLRASYNPIFDLDGKPYKIVKYASDVTQSKLRDAEYEGKISAIDKSQAVIEFNLDGIVLDANANFLATMGYTLEELRGQHHRMLCEPEYTQSDAYRAFWEKLRSGEFDAGRYKRIGRGQKVVWIHATYNPIFDLHGRPYKIVKFATDVTAQVELENSIASRAESDRLKVDTLLASVSRAAAGDLTTLIEVNGNEPIDLLAQGIRQMIGDLRGVISTVVGAASNFGTSSIDIAGRSNGVAAGAQALGATVEQMNASIEELSASIDSIAGNGRSADALAKATQQEAETGAIAVNRSIEVMTLIDKSSEDISEITKVIGEIASQTNLLAFNAAIEAARAGEHGLGFSVVADEVRKLAERSSQAAKEISKLIGESVKRVALGSEVSRQAGDAFGKIVTGVAKTTQAIAEIACAADEQMLAAREVSTAIQHVAEETEKSAMSCDGIAHATHDLSDGAKRLNDTVARFVV